MSSTKQRVRERFRNAVFLRDGNSCRVCRTVPPPDKLDAHHITPREQMPVGGYVAENGVSLCWKCHVLAEAHLGGPGPKYPDYTPEAHYKRIGSSPEAAREASSRLARCG